MAGIIFAQPSYSNLKLLTKEIIAVNNTIKTNKSVVLANSAIEGSEVVLLNGVELINDINCDYTFTDDKTIQFNSSWTFEIGDKFFIKYYKK